jgi:hypothetical protein
MTLESLMMMNTKPQTHFGHVFIHDAAKKVDSNAILKAAQDSAKANAQESILGSTILEEGKRGTYTGYLFETAKPEYDAFLLEAAKNAGAKAEAIQDDKLKQLKDAKMPWKMVLGHPFKVLTMDIPEQGAFIPPFIVKILLIAGWPKMIWEKITGKL